MSSPTYSTLSRKEDASPGNGADQRDEEVWSGEDPDDEGDSRKRKRPRNRPVTRKVKCDRGEPSCGWCLRNGQVCEYKERKKPGLRAGYGRELEARLDQLEGVLQNQQNVLQQLANHLPGAQNGSASLASPTAHSQHVPQAETALFMQTPSMYPTAAPVGRRLSGLQSQMAGDRSQQGSNFLRHASKPSLQTTMTGSSDGYTATDPPLESPSLNIPSTNPMGMATHEGAMNAVSQDQDFPPYDLLYALTDLFFKHINTWCPMLHRRTTLDSLFGPSTLEEADRILLHAIVATTLRFSQDSRLNDQSRERYHNTSKQKVLLYGLENSSVKALQALVILALDIVGNSNGPPGWNLLALITRSVVQLGLAVEATSASVAPVFPSIYTLRAMVLPEPTSFIEDESRRRLFWMIYLLDRYATVATAFEFALDDKEIDRKLPCRDDLFSRNQPVDTKWFQTAERTDYSTNKPENLGSFSYYIEIIGILSQIHRFLKKPVDIGALSDVEQWQQEYRDLDSKLSAWKFSLPSEYGNMSRIFNASGGNKIVNPAIGPLVETLREMGYYWKVAERYATLLQRVLDEYSESERAPVGANGVRETPSTVRILADMRRCAYDLDFLISRQPRQHFGSKLNSVTPARTPAPNELEYLDVFDFFNMPRLPLSANGDPGMAAAGGVNGGAATEYPAMEGIGSNEFNITNFMYDANSDWFTNSK
ncbi:hypothetical protein LTR37_010262 [Vermiconidia calcicola]|uniref:Uncharacterized protein n=1 Tax=Vermiconidia calcicola TaxID=1690605 RepID=A0ACC3N5T4_9PEZI|nr:hypothetical protein LTR37_010262 [Vermiconidia calcicola]